MQELGFEQLKSDASLFVYKRGKDICSTRYNLHQRRTLLQTLKEPSQKD